jgi:DNA polymerase II small subunit
MNVQALIAQLFDKDILITPEQAKLLTDKDAQILIRLLDKPKAVEEYLERLGQAPAPVQVKANTSVHVLKHYDKKPKKRSYNDFVQYFNVRFQTMERMLKARKELSGVMSIERTKQYASDGKQQVAIIGLVLDKRETKNGHIIFELEDRSGSINVLASVNKQELFEQAKDLTLDEIVGVVGTLKENIIFAESIVIPNVPVHNELKKAPEEVYMVCISDLHFGNKNFFKEDFALFMRWLAGKEGSAESRAIAAKTKYVIIAGDLVEGVGVYPSQENDLEIPDIFDQYKYTDEILSTLPEDKHVIVIPGNHDIGRLSEPQPRIPADMMPKLAARPNTYFVSNPSVVRLHQVGSFPGFTTLLYHGGSFFYYGNNIMRLFKDGGMSNPVGIMQYLLTRRHLAPTHTSTLYVPDSEIDSLIIDEIPDFFITGHLHTTQAKTWQGITMLSCSCWVPLTEYQIKAGLKIDPGKFMLVNLQTRAASAITPKEITS